MTVSMDIDGELLQKRVGEAKCSDCNTSKLSYNRHRHEIYLHNT